jgi:hypothetical protein
MTGLQRGINWTLVSWTLVGGSEGGGYRRRANGGHMYSSVDASPSLGRHGMLTPCGARGAASGSLWAW